MSDSAVLFEREGGVVRLTLNRPEAGNAINLDLARALLASAIKCDGDDTIRCVVLTGSGKLFCAGGDVPSIAAMGDQKPQHLSELAGTLHMAVSRLARMNKPLLGLVNGAAAGAGIALAVLGDVVLATRGASFTVAYSGVGLTPDGGSSWLLPRLVGLRKAQEMILTNRRVNATEAEAIGLITRAVDDDKFAEEGAAMAATLSKAPTQALGGARRLLLDSYSTSLETQMEHETRSLSAAGGRKESTEGMAAFLERRKPNFEGL